MRPIKGRTEDILDYNIIYSQTLETFLLKIEQEGEKLKIAPETDVATLIMGLLFFINSMTNRILAQEHISAFCYANELDFKKRVKQFRCI